MRASKGRAGGADSRGRRRIEASPIGAGAPEGRQAVLDERARRLALPVAAADAREFIEVLTFTVGQTRYAIEYGWVQEVVRFASVTPVPGTPAFVVGVTNYRGHILCLFDLRGLLRLPTAPLNDLARIIVMGSGAPEFGLLADRTEDTRRLMVTDIVASTDPADAGGNTLAKGITHDGIVLLDGARVLRDTRLVIDRR